MTCEGALLGASDWYHELGWSILPVAGKKPLKGWKWKDRKIDRARVERGISNPLTTGIAAILGSPSGDLFARDFDRVDSYEAWTRQYFELAKTLPTARTARGFHIYGTAPEVRTQMFDDGEMRAANSLIVLPPSRTVGSETILSYQWIVRPGEQIPRVDPAIFGADSHTQNRGERNAPEEYQSLHVFGTNVGDPENWITESIRKTIPTRRGERNRKLWALARRIRRLYPKDASLEILYPIVMRWYGEARPTIGTKEFGDTWRDFKCAWANVEVAFNDAFKRLAQAGIDESWTCGLGKNVDAVGRLMQSASHARGGDFFMSYAYIESTIGISRQPAYEAVQRLLGAGFVQIVEKGSRGTHQGRATTWRWVGIQSDAARERAVRGVAGPTSSAFPTAS